jgi:SP family sugar:H+ symporter-like MFS transporter
MYVTHVPPRKSSRWEPPREEDLVTAEKVVDGRVEGVNV